MDQKNLFEVLTGHGKPLEFMLFNTMQLVLRNLMRIKEPGLRYVVPSFLSSCFLGHVIELLFYLFINSIPSAVYAFFGCESN